MTPVLYIGNKNYSSWSLRSWLLLAEAGIAFDEVRIPLDLPETQQRIREVSRAGCVPVLQLGDEIVWDTLAIAETVAERWPEAQLWPGDARDRARARAISAEMHSGFAALRDALPMNCRATGRKVPIADAVRRDIERIVDIWADCQAAGRPGGWLFGRFGVADAMYAPVVLRFRSYGIDIPERASRYPSRLLESEALQRWLQAAEAETEVIEREEKGL